MVRKYKTLFLTQVSHTHVCDEVCISIESINVIFQVPGRTTAPRPSIGSSSARGVSNFPQIDFSQVRVRSLLLDM